MDKVYEKLVKLRQVSNLSQKQIASFLNVDQSFISKVESGERQLNTVQLDKLVHLYGYDIESFNAETLKPLHFAFRAKDVTVEDLNAIADISRIAMNSRFMSKLLEDSDD